MWSEKESSERRIDTFSLIWPLRQIEVCVQLTPLAEKEEKKRERGR